MILFLRKAFQTDNRIASVTKRRLRFKIVRELNSLKFRFVFLHNPLEIEIFEFSNQLPDSVGLVTILSVWLLSIRLLPVRLLRVEGLGKITEYGGQKGPFIIIAEDKGESKTEKWGVKGGCYGKIGLSQFENFKILSNLIIAH